METDSVRQSSAVRTMDDADSHHKAFECLRPVCVQLTRVHTRENVGHLKAALGVVDSRCLQHLQEYVLFPLRLIIKQTSPDTHEDLLIDVLACMRVVLRASSISRVEMFTDLFNSTCLLLSSPDSQTNVRDVCEELKLQLVHCLSDLLASATHSVLQTVYSTLFLPALGHAVSVLLHLAETEQLKELRIEAMLCLCALAQCRHHKVSSSLSQQAGDSFASFLPGVAVSLCRVITGEVTQGQAVTKCAVDSWVRLVTLVLGDLSIDQCTPHQQTSQVTQSPGKYDQLRVVRSKEWVAMAAAKLRLLVSQIATLVSHSNWRVRLALADGTATLLNKCANSLEGSTGILLEVLVTLTRDEYPNVASKSSAALEDFCASRDLSRSKSLIALLEENLYSLATALPRLVHTASETKKLTTLKLFSGYLKLLGHQVSRLLYSVCHLQRVSLALLQILELDTSQVLILQERHTGGAFSCLAPHRHFAHSRKCFKHFVDENIFEEIILIARMLGFYGDLHLLVDHFLDQFHQSSVYSKQALVIINEVILGTTGQGLSVDVRLRTNEPSVVSSVISSLLDVYLQPSVWSPATTPTSTLVSAVHERYPSTVGERTPHVEQLNNDVLQVCLLLEGVSVFAQVQGSEFKYHLTHALYPVLEKLGSDNALITQAAYLTLVSMATTCGCGSVAKLLEVNADYLVNDVSLRLRHYGSGMYPMAPTVLKVIIQYSNRDIVPLLNDTIQELLCTLDECYEDWAVDFICVLNTLAGTISKWFPHSESEEKENLIGTQHRRERETADSVADFIKDYHSQRLVADGNVEDEETDVIQDAAMHAGTADGSADCEVDAEVDSEKKELPKHIQIIMQVLERCQHLMSSPNPRMRLLVLDTVGKCCQALRSTREKLLPLIHKVWPPFAHRFNDSEEMVVIKAFETLYVMGDVCGDFIRQRVVKDVLPKMASYLEKQAGVSVKVGPSYRFTVASRLQCCMLQSAGEFCRTMGLRQSDTGRLAATCVPYLSSRQPSHLQQACLQTFEELQIIDPDTVWLLLCDIYCPQPLIAPHSAFKVIKMAGSEERNEYTDNVALLMGK